MQNLADGLLFDCTDNPRLIAVVEDNRVADLWSAQGGSARMGSIHLARVTGRFDHHQRLSGQLLSGASVSWPAKGRAKIISGQLAPITITAAARQDKPLQAVTGIELAGRYTVLRWHSRNKGQLYFSRKAGKLASSDEMLARLTQLSQATGVLDAGFDVVVRRSALSADQKLEEQILNFIQAEITGLLAGWTEQAGKFDGISTQTQPRLIYAGPQLGNQLRQLYPQLRVRQLGPDDWPAVIRAYEQAEQTRYETAHGAVLWIEQTKAAVMVDIDSAGSKLAPDRLCELILPELMTQLRLRRLAGKILIDMPYVTQQKRGQILAKIDRLSRRDPRCPDCLGFSRSGLLEFSIRHSRLVLDKDDELRAVIDYLAKGMV